MLERVGRGEPEESADRSDERVETTYASKRRTRRSDVRVGR